MLIQNVFDVRSQFLLSNGKWGKNVVIFGVGNGFSVHADYKERCLSSWWRLIIQAKYSINITKTKKKISLSLLYNGSNSCLYANTLNMYQYKAKH